MLVGKTNKENGSGGRQQLFGGRKTHKCFMQASKQASQIDGPADKGRANESRRDDASSFTVKKRKCHGDGFGWEEKKENTKKMKAKEWMGVIVSK